MSPSAAAPDPDAAAAAAAAAGRPAELDPSAPVEDLPGVGPARARALKEAGLVTLGDLCLHALLQLRDVRLQPGHLLLVAAGCCLCR